MVEVIEVVEVVEVVKVRGVRYGGRSSKFRCIVHTAQAQQIGSLL